MISKASVNRNLIMRTVVSALRTQGPQVAEQLQERLYGEEPEAEELLGGLIEDMATYLEDSTETTSRLSSNVLTEAAQDLLATQAVSAAVESLREEIQWHREQLHGIYGPAVVADYGYVGTLPHGPDQLTELSKSLEGRLRKNNLPARTRKGRPGLDGNALAKRLEEDRTALEEACAYNAREERRTQHARLVRDQAVEQWNHDYRGVATIAVGLFELAGMPGLAERVRPTARRRQQLPEDIDLGDIGKPPRGDGRDDSGDEEEPDTEPLD